MNKFIKKKITENISLKKKIYKSKSILQKIDKIEGILYSCLNDNKKILFCGNGGSCSDAQHLATELIVRLRPKVNRKAIRSLSLSLDPTFLTACSNDFGYENIYKRSLEAISEKGDVLVALSTSGNSNNIIKALKAAKKNKLKTVSFLGSGGGRSRDLADVNLIVPSKDTARIQECHIFLGHLIMEMLEKKLIKNKKI